MSRRILRPRTDICYICDFLTAQRTLSRAPIRASKPVHTSRQFSSSRIGVQKLQKSTASPATSSKTSIPLKSNHAERVGVTHLLQPEQGQWFKDVKAACNSLLSQKNIPSEEETTRALTQCEALSKLLTIEPVRHVSGRKDRAGSTLLDLDDPSGKETTLLKQPPAVQLMRDELSKLAYSVITHPPVFITPEVLRLYVEVQATLKRPETLPEAFHLYGNKLLPQEGSSPIRYSEQNPNKIANAISQPVADRALQAAIDTKDLMAAMDIIEFSYGSTAFRRAKFVRIGLLPSVGLAAAPVAAYGLASQLALFQTAMETGMATNVAFAGIVAYVGFTATIGVVALTTANDQMDRVTWAPGLPLRQRWIREDERAAIDKVAAAWGFRETWRKGEEEGEEWDAIRDWVGLKGMILDRTELMEGME